MDTAVDLKALAAAHPEHWARATAIRALTLDAVHAANSGHSGMPMGMADVATVLFEKHLKFDASAPDWADRDRFILSAGHGSMLLYSLLYLTGYPEMTLDQIKVDTKLKDMVLVKNSRLSVQPVTPEEWVEVCRMGGLTPAP